VTILCGVEFATSTRFKISYDEPGSRNERVKRMDGLQKSQQVKDQTSLSLDGQNVAAKVGHIAGEQTD